MKTSTKIYRQGELAFIPIVEITEAEKEKLNSCISPKNTNCIREGEVTGHKHEIIGNATLSDISTRSVWINNQLVSLNGQMLLDAPEESVKIKHPEHQTLHLDKGKYFIRIQREYDEEKDRLVSD